MSEAETVKEPSKTIKTLEEDDEFEDFPEDGKCFESDAIELTTDWTEEKSLGAVQQDHLWDESWDDDDNEDDFTKKLR
ncbi:hypothetical protein OGAPHI_001490 [Ogataea philodendri]|uniref:26S proteasome complex subunit SEM1 n=1 Tax=Ogataea philodendri TaxID=1378263 RepID=A0A9P8PDB6_9ASCO|nr:uncharacterized protein OGAPHI_001490 [Ogataea philodendri]KAH3669369.1 hypothetical protein OGAPHI_001490 [Ogataea philodendri]